MTKTMNLAGLLVVAALLGAPAWAGSGVFGQLKSLASALGISAANTRLAAPAVAPVPVGPEVQAKYAGMEMAEFLMGELRRADSVSYSRGLVDRLENLAKAQPEDQELQMFVVQGLGEELRRVGNVSYSYYLLRALENIVSSSQNGEVCRNVITTLMDEVLHVGNISYSLSLAEAVTRMAVKSGIPETKDLTVSLLLREVKRVNNVYYSQRLLALVDQITASAR